MRFLSPARSVQNVQISHPLINMTGVCIISTQTPMNACPLLPHLAKGISQGKVIQAPAIHAIKAKL